MRRTRWLAGAAFAIAALAGSPAAHAAETPATVDRVTVESFDGVELGGWLIRPGDEGKRKLPTVFISTPYIGQCIATGVARHTGAVNTPCWPTPETPADWAEHPEPIELLVQNGYAVAMFSVRGTGVSGGCLDDLGPREQRDQRVLVNWIAAQSWSNERVGAMGLSYMSQTALSAAVMRPKALKTVVVSGVNADFYSYFHTPQGLAFAHATVPTEATYAADISLSPPGAFRPDDPALLAARLQHHHERACPEVVRAMVEPTKGSVTAGRDAEFWLDRRLTSRFKRIRASVLIAQGLQDLWQSGHAFQEDVMWSQIRSPKAMYVGQWAHSYPWQSGPVQTPVRPDLKDEWFATLIPWLDHYLDGGPKPGIVGRARFEDDSLTWHESKSWPPRESRDEVLYLAPERELATAAPRAESALAFRSYPQPERTTVQEGFMCPARLEPALGPAAQTFLTAPVQERTVIAGNPMAYLDLKSDQEGGGFQVLLYDVGPEFDCATATTQGKSKGVRPLTIGGADLRFHHGGFVAKPFSEGHVRVDIANLAAVLEPGHRLGISIGYGDPIEFDEVGHAPRIEIGTGPRADSSQLVMPVLEGGLVERSRR